MANIIPGYFVKKIDVVAAGGVNSDISANYAYLCFNADGSIEFYSSIITTADIAQNQVIFDLSLPTLLGTAQSTPYLHSYIAALALTNSGSWGVVTYEFLGSDNKVYNRDAFSNGDTGTPYFKAFRSDNSSQPSNLFGANYRG